MHCIIDWVPSTDDVVFALNQQRIEIDINSADGIVGTVCVVIKNSVSKPYSAAIKYNDRKSSKPLNGV